MRAVSRDELKLAPTPQGVEGGKAAARAQLTHADAALGDVTRGEQLGAHRARQQPIRDRRGDPAAIPAEGEVGDRRFGDEARAVPEDHVVAVWAGGGGGVVVTAAGGLVEDERVREIDRRGSEPRTDRPGWRRRHWTGLHPDSAVFINQQSHAQRRIATHRGIQGGTRRVAGERHAEVARGRRGPVQVAPGTQETGAGFPAECLEERERSDVGLEDAGLCHAFGVLAAGARIPDDAAPHTVRSDLPLSVDGGRADGHIEASLAPGAGIANRSGVDTARPGLEFTNDRGGPHLWGPGNRGAGKDRREDRRQRTGHPRHHIGCHLQDRGEAFDAKEARYLD